MMCSTYAWRSTGVLSARASVGWQSRFREVYEPLAVRTAESGREEPAGAGDDGKGCKGCKWCKRYERQEPGGEGATDSFRNARTRAFALLIQSGIVTSNQISRALQRSQVS